MQHHQHTPTSPTPLLTASLSARHGDARLHNLLDSEEAETNRRRQTADLKHIATYYALERRFGIHIAIGGRVRTNGREGTIVDTAGEQLKIQFDGAEMPSTRHVTWDMEYRTATGWTAAKPVPVP
ncbi:hypothetical protein AB0N79_36405 [Streptomyces microflavus]|uniref:hypothetical protein n=1 Tax=Streptomyces microflavus TaxID=1919 RepID=UPI002258F5BD|nr:hypothetical protein [Streptomyces microflavus]MCX4657411.1 hypothetical protein [Streptomyces microflavus]